MCLKANRQPDCSTSDADVMALMLLILLLQVSPVPVPQQPLAQQQIAEPSETSLTNESQAVIPPSAESNLLLQIQVLTEQLLATTAMNIGFLQPPQEPTSNKASSMVNDDHSPYGHTN